MGNQNRPTGLLSRFSRSASDSNLVNHPPPGGLTASSSDPQSALSPPITSHHRRILNSFGWKSPLSSPLASTSFVSVTAPVSITISAQNSPQLTASPAKTDTVWTKALDIAQNKLREQNLPQLDPTKLTSDSAGENIDAVVKSLNVLQQDEQKNRWKYTWRGKEVVIAERLGKILRSIEKYSTVVGTAIQCDPQVSAIVWAGILGIMRVCI